MRNKNTYTVENGVGYVHVTTLKGQEYEFIVDIDVIDFLISNNINLCMHSSRGRNYAKFRANGKNILLHKFITGTTSKEIVDHVDGNQQNNLRSNLKVGTHKDNIRNANNRPFGSIPIRGLSYHNREKGTVRFDLTGYPTKLFPNVELAKEHIRRLGLPLEREMIS
ncbi:HNH endonuclease [Bacillus cereus]|uniref:HNH endonuclease n=1 Tax=Bacillus cereus TaxID=1396 RepID=UPI000BFA8A8D|nr:HNH endonuclease [Bacillus cereus]PEZ62984.1 hypothetical protein CN370_08015 [Bacillus cereus]